MDQWEYKTHMFAAKVSLEEEEQKLNSMGEQGWELVSTIIWTGGEHHETIHYFKRRAQSSTAYRG